MPLSERPIEKAYLQGLTSLNNYELLAIIIGSGVKNKNAIEISFDIINYFNGLENLFNQNYKQLIKFKGLNKIKSLRLNAFFELCKRKNDISYLEKYDKSNIKTFVNRVNNYIYDFTYENLIIVILNNNNKVVSIQNFIRNNDLLKVKIVEIIKHLIKSSAKKFLLIHNHPNKLIDPSLEDLNFIKLLKEEIKKFNLILVDSIIVSEDDYFSFYESNLL